MYYVNSSIATTAATESQGLLGLETSGQLLLVPQGAHRHVPIRPQVLPCCATLDG